MIIQALITMLLAPIYGLLAILPSLPQFPLAAEINELIDIVFTNTSGLLGFFIRISTIKLALPALLILVNFERIYRFIMWIIKKIPMLNIK